MPYFRGYPFLIGVDPEGFLYDNYKKRFLSAHDIVPGTKENPAPIPGHHCGMIQADGMAVEFNTPPVVVQTDFLRVVRETIRSVNKFLTNFSPNLKLKFVPTAHFDEEVWESTPGTAKRLGCDPDFNAWTGKLNSPPDPDGKRYRTGAGHIHIGWTRNLNPFDDNLFKICCVLSKELDARLGVSSVLFDGDKERRTLYGKAGAFRPKPYGIEYRTLSNRWIRNTDLQKYVMARTKESIGAMYSRKFIHTQEVEEIINNNKKDDAAHWLAEYNIPLPPVMED